MRTALSEFKIGKDSILSTLVVSEGKDECRLRKFRKYFFGGYLAVASSAAGPRLSRQLVRLQLSCEETSDASGKTGETNKCAKEYLLFFAVRVHHFNYLIGVNSTVKQSGVNLSLSCHVKLGCGGGGCYS